VTRSVHRRRPLLALVAVLATVSGLVAPVALSTLSAAPAAADRVLPYQDPSLPVAARVDDLLRRMRPAEKIGQMTQTERYQVFDDPAPITTYGLGSILSGGGSTPATNTPAAWADMVDRFQAAALQTRLGIPLLYGIDSVHGDGNLYGATVFPHNIGLGATRNPALVRDVAHITAEETRATGPQWTFSPCVCAARDDRWGRTYESFSENPALVEQMETAIDGYQGPPGSLDDNDRVLATAKHYAGDGDTVYGTAKGDYKIDQGISVTNHQDFWDVALRQYVPAVQDHHVGSVMPSYSSVDWTEDGVGNPLKMHAHKELITDVLKGQMKFHGFVISDWEGIHQITDPADPANGGLTAFKVRTGVNAGIDMMMEPNNYKDFITLLTAEVKSGGVSAARIDDAVRRILTAKFELGLFEHPYTDRTHIGAVGSAAHHAVARTAVQQSQVLLKNDRSTLPIKTQGRIYVAGSNANNIGNQAGGWTLTWQGGSTNKIPGTTILDGIRAVGGSHVTYSETASAPVTASDVGVVVVGETPYSEGFGDVGGPRWAYDPGDNNVPRPVKDMKLSAADSAAVDKVCAAAAKCVVVIVSGRPLILDPQQLQRVDALVEAWLPGAEGAGVADPLFGKVGYTGKLPMSWPRTLAQEPINVGDASYDPLYSYGYGLRTR
jgi:beta-glucosidase